MISHLVTFENMILNINDKRFIQCGVYTLHWIFCILPVCMTTCLKKLPLTVFCLCEIKIACMVEAANDGIEQLRFEGAKIL